MKDSFPQRLDSESIRQGLLSIRNSQIELLNQLKIETQQLKKAPSRYGLSVQPIKFEERLTNNDDFAVSSSNTSQIPLQQKNSPSAAFLYQKHCSLVVADERNETVQKLLYPKSSDKQRVRQLQNYLYLSQKITTQLINQLIAGTPLSQIKRNWQSDLQLNKDIYSKYQQSHHQLVLQMLRERESVGVLNRPNSSESAKERDLAVQLRELKEQLSIIVNNSQQKGQRTSIDVENSRLREQEELLTRRCEEMQKEIHKFDRENRELALCWERESSQRKSLLNQLQKMRKKIAASEQKEKAAVLLQKDLQQRLANPQKLLKDKQTTDPVPLQNAKKLTQAVGMLREQNDKLRREIKAINETKSNAERQQLQAMKQVQSQLISKQAQQTAMLRNYQQQIHDLRSHLCEVKKNQEMMMQAQSKQKENEMANQELIWRKVYAIKTNSTVQHLWQIKNAEYENVGRVLYELRRH